METKRIPSRGMMQSVSDVLCCFLIVNIGP